MDTSWAIEMGIVKAIETDTRRKTKMQSDILNVIDIIVSLILIGLFFVIMILAYVFKKDTPDISFRDMSDEEWEEYTDYWWTAP